jgi:hypothetical protein
MKYSRGYGSHLPVLMKVVGMTTGPILELGTGWNSTPVLHWMCYPTKRKLVSYDAQEKYMDVANMFVDDFHEVHLVSDWDAIDLTPEWSVAFVDHSPNTRRIIDIKRLVHADYVVVHDTELRRDKDYGYSEIYPLFKYHYKYRDVYPHTSVLSNKHDLRNFRV